MNFCEPTSLVPILLVDDRPENLLSLEALLGKHDYELVRALSGNEALRLTLKHDFALVLLDVQMPDMDGFETAELMRSHPKTRHIPVIFVTAGMKSLQFQFKGYDTGAVDYLLKPIEPVFLQSKVKVFAELYRQRCELERHKHHLEELVDQKTAELQQIATDLQASLALSNEAEYEICVRLGRAAEFRDLETGQHTRRISEMAAALAELAGLTPAMVKLLRFASPLHDVGKVGIPDQILLKPGKLDEQEMETIRLHTILGGRLLAEAGHFPALKLGRVIALQHHEKWDGSGYPHGLRCKEISLVARIVTIVDIFDALLSDRPYKNGFALPKAVEIMREGEGSFFDPGLLPLFLNNLQHFVTIRNQLHDKAQDLALARQLLPKCCQTGE
jgi:putative two-component system response regulator